MMPMYYNIDNDNQDWNRVLGHGRGGKYPGKEKGKGKGQGLYLGKGKGSKGKGYSGGGQPSNAQPLQPGLQFPHQQQRMVLQPGPQFQFQQPRQGANFSAIWVCPTCGNQHPWYHSSCYECDPPHQYVHVQRRRWDKKRLGKGTAKGGGNVKNDDEDDEMGVEFMEADAAPAAKCDPAMLSKVVAWLKHQQADGSVIKVIDDLHSEQVKSESNGKPSDPWRSLQSAKDKLINVEGQLDSAYQKIQELNDALNAAVEGKDELESKKENLEEDVKVLQQRALLTMNASQSDSQNLHCEAIVQELREQIFNGMPEPQSAGSARVYQLLFGLQGTKGSGKATREQSDSQESDHSKDLHFGVDVQSSAFGPTKGTKASPSPYSKGSANTETTGKGISQQGGASGEGPTDAGSQR